jgi:alpha-galactosidase
MTASTEKQKTTATGRPVLAVVGAGSLVWGRSIVVDIMCNPDLADAEIRLIDIMPDRLALVQEWLEFAKQVKGWGHSISAHTDLREGLRGVTACLTAISVGGDRQWRYDSMHPQLDGIFQTVGDTTGPGGAVRALRHAPALKKIAQTLVEVGAPSPILIQTTNPLNPLTSLLDEIPGLRVFGFCHGYEDTEHRIAKSLGIAPPDSDWGSNWREGCPRVNVELAGNNHFVFLDRLMIGDRTYDQKSIAELIPALFDGPFREEVWSRYGVFVGNDARHPIEFLPDFLTRDSQFGRAWGVSPIASEINPEHGDRHDDRQPQLEADLKAARADLSTCRNWQLDHSREPIAEIIAAFHTGNRFDVHLNLRNDGALRGVFTEAHLEMFCRIEDGQVHRPQVEFPESVTVEIERVARSQQLLTRCCAHYDEDLLVESLRLDALMPKDEGKIRRLIREMVDFQKHFIDQSE